MVFCVICFVGIPSKLQGSIYLWHWWETSPHEKVVVLDLGGGGGGLCTTCPYYCAQPRRKDSSCAVLYVTLALDLSTRSGEKCYPHSKLVLSNIPLAGQAPKKPVIKLAEAKAFLIAVSTLGKRFALGDVAHPVESFHRPTSLSHLFIEIPSVVQCCMFTNELSKKDKSFGYPISVK